MKIMSHSQYLSCRNNPATVVGAKPWVNKTPNRSIRSSCDVRVTNQCVKRSTFMITYRTVLMPVFVCSNLTIVSPPTKLPSWVRCGHPRVEVP